MFRSAEDHVVDPSSARIIRAAVSSRDVTERMLENSYHVATLDNDAPHDLRGVRPVHPTSDRTMTSPDDGRDDDPARARPTGRATGPLDEDAAWRAIVENYGDRADAGRALDGRRRRRPARPEPPVEPVAAAGRPTSSTRSLPRRRSAAEPTEDAATPRSRRGRTSCRRSRRRSRSTTPARRLAWVGSVRRPAPDAASRWSAAARPIPTWFVDGPGRGLRRRLRVPRRDHAPRPRRRLAATTARLCKVRCAGSPGVPDAGGAPCT